MSDLYLRLPHKRPDQGSFSTTASLHNRFPSVAPPCLTSLRQSLFPRALPFYPSRKRKFPCLSPNTTATFQSENNHAFAVNTSLHCSKGGAWARCLLKVFGCILYVFFILMPPIYPQIYLAANDNDRQHRQSDALKTKKPKAF